MAAGDGRAFGLNQVDKLLGVRLRVRLEFRQQFLLKLDHILNGGARRAVKRAPRAAVKRFVQMDMHVAHGRQHQFTARIVARQRGVRVAQIAAQGDDFAVFISSVCRSVRV